MKFLRTPFLQNTCGRLPLDFKYQCMYHTTILLRTSFWYTGGLLNDWYCEYNQCFFSYKSVLIWPLNQWHFYEGSCYLFTQWDLKTLTSFLESTYMFKNFFDTCQQIFTFGSVISSSIHSKAVRCVFKQISNFLQIFFCCFNGKVLNVHTLISWELFPIYAIQQWVTTYYNACFFNEFLVSVYSFAEFIIIRIFYCNNFKDLSTATTRNIAIEFVVLMELIILIWNLLLCLF